jgi:hypothetical protein
MARRKAGRCRISNKTEAAARAVDGVITEESSMFVIDRSNDAATHRACVRIANRLVFMIRPLLRSADERDRALSEAYAIARDEIEARKRVDQAE